MVSEKLFELLRSQEQIKKVLNSVESGRVVASLSVAMTVCICHTFSALLPVCEVFISRMAVKSPPSHFHLHIVPEFLVHSIPS